MLGLGDLGSDGFSNEGFRTQCVRGHSVIEPSYVRSLSVCGTM